MTFALGFTLPTKQNDIEVTIRNRKIPVRVIVKRTIPTGHQVAHICKFIGIAADDWDRIVRYIHDLPDIEHVGSYFDPNVPDDDYRLLPTSIQRKIIAVLVARGRLNPPPVGVAPLIIMKKVSETRTKDNFVKRKIHIHSRVIDENEQHSDHDSYFQIDSNSNVIVL